MERLIVGLPALARTRRGAVPARRILLHAPEVPRCRERLRRDHQRWAPSSSYYELALYKLGWTLYKQEFYDEALHQYIALLDYKVSIGYDFDETARRGRRAARRGHLPRHQPELLEPRRPRGRAGILRGQRPAQLRGPHLRQPRRVLPRQAALRRCREDVQGVRRALSVPPRRRRTSACAWSRSTRKGGLPEARARVEEGRSRRRYGLQAEYWRHFDARRVAGGAELPQEQPEGPREPLSRAVPERGAGGRRSPPTTREALHWYREYLASFPKDAESPPINYQLADLLLENKDFGEAALRVRAHGLRLSDACEVGRGRLCRDLRAPRAPQESPAEEQRRARDARHGRELAASSRTRSRSTSRPRRCSVRRPTISTR